MSCNWFNVFLFLKGGNALFPLPQKKGKKEREGEKKRKKKEKKRNYCKEEISTINLLLYINIKC